MLRKGCPQDLRIELAGGRVGAILGGHFSGRQVHHGAVVGVIQPAGVALCQSVEHPCAAFRVFCVTCENPCLGQWQRLAGYPLRAIEANQAAEAHVHRPACPAVGMRSRAILRMRGLGRGNVVGEALAHLRSGEGAGFGELRVRVDRAAVLASELIGIADAPAHNAAFTHRTLLTDASGAYLPV